MQAAAVVGAQESLLASAQLRALTCPMKLRDAEAIPRRSFVSVSFWVGLAHKKPLGWGLFLQWLSGWKSLKAALSSHLISCALVAPLFDSPSRGMSPEHGVAWDRHLGMAKHPHEGKSEQTAAAHLSL